MTKELRVIILEDVATDAQLIENQLRRAGFAVVSTRCSVRDEFLADLDRFEPDVVLSDYNLNVPGFDGLAALKIVRRVKPDVPFVLVTGALTDESAVSIVENGANDYVLKEHLPRLPFTIRRVLQEREVQRLKSDFVSTAAHELRTPVTVIRGFAEVLLTRNDVTPAESRRYLTHIHIQADRLGDIIDSLLDLRGSGLQLDLQKIDINEIIRKAIDRCRPHGAAHEFVVACAATPEGCHGDGRKLVELFANIVDNAIKFSADGTAIVVRGVDLGAEYAIKISDKGIGMSTEDVEHVCERFWRADASNTAMGGIGLGMSVVEALVNAHHGRMTIESIPSEGTTVSVFLPVSR